MSSNASVKVFDIRQTSPIEMLRLDVKRIYALTGRDDQEEYSSIETMNVKQLQKKAVLWWYMVKIRDDTLVRLMCGHSHVLPLKMNQLAQYPTFIQDDLRLTKKSYNVHEIRCETCPQTFKIDYFAKPEERDDKTKMTLDMLKTLADLEDSIPTPVLAEELDKTTDELAKANLEIKRLKDVISVIKTNLG